MIIVPIPAFNDNYIWCIHDNVNAIVVDPGDHIVVDQFLEQHNLNLSSILVTHHHFDHTGGILELKNKSFNGFIEWVLDLRKKLDLPHKLSEVIEEKDFELDRLSKMALEDPSTSGNPKKLTESDMKIMYQHSITGELFK